MRNSQISHNLTECLVAAPSHPIKKTRKSPTPPETETNLGHNPEIEVQEDVNAAKKQRSTSCFHSETAKREDSVAINVNNSFAAKQQQQTNVVSPQNKKSESKIKSRNFSSTTYGKGLKLSKDEKEKAIQLGGTMKKLDMKAYNPNLIFQHVGSMLRKKQEQTAQVMQG